MSAQLKHNLKVNLKRNKVPAYMRVVEDIKYRPIGSTEINGKVVPVPVRTKSVIHVVQIHDGDIKRFMGSQVSHLQVYIAKDLGQVSYFARLSIYAL
jgi:uncharacterized protein (DUF39 family)